MMIKSFYPPLKKGGQGEFNTILPPLKKGGQGGIPKLHLFLLLLLSGLFALFSGNLALTQPPQPLTSPQPDSSAFRGNLFKLLKENPLPYDQNISNLPLVRVNGCDAALVQVRSKFSGTYHAAQDEILYIISGRGVMIVAGETKPIQPGDLVILKCGQIYTLENRSAETLVGLAVVSQENDH